MVTSALDSDNREGTATKLKYAVVIERTDSDYLAYVPDLPGCIGAGDSHHEMEAMILHQESPRKHDNPVPEPKATVTLVEV